MADQKYQYPSQEVSALRKQGDLEKALGLAREIFRKDPNNEWNVQALAWCLYDEIKRLKAGTESEALDGVKKELAALKLPSNSSILVECVARALGTDAAGRATELSNTGKHREAVDLLRPIAKRKEASQYEIEAYGWILFRKIKDCAQDEERAPVWCLNEFLNCWTSDRKPNPMLFKNILIQVKRHAENWTGIIALIEKLGLHQLKPEEFADETPDSKYSPFQDQLLGAVHKSLKMHSELHGERPALNQLLTAWKDSFEKGKFGHYYLSRILLWTRGDQDQARVHLLKAVQENPDEYWRWQALAEALVGPELKIVLSKAICCSTEDESLKIPLLKKYAYLLAAEGELGPASASIKEAIRLRTLSGSEWRDPMPAWLHRDNADGNLDILDYARPYSDMADEILADGLEACVCAIVRPLKAEGRFLCIKEDGQTITLKFRKSEGPASAMVAIRAKYLEKAGGASTVLSWEPCSISSNFGILQIGVVFEIKKDGNFASVATPSRSFIPIFYDRWPEARSLVVGDCMNLWWMRIEGEKSHVLGWTKTEREEEPYFFIPIKGLFTQGSGQSHGLIDCDGETIFVHATEAQRLKRGQKIHGWAVRLKDQHRGNTWRLVLSQP